MIDQFKGITEAEFEELINALSLITVLIAGADGRIDNKEKEWAQKVANIRSYTLPEGLKEFYLLVNQDFEERLDIFIDKYFVSEDGQASIRRISEKLSGLNNILPRIEDREIAIGLYESYVSFAKHVAKASGGFLSWGSVGPQEKKLISLSMLDVVSA